MDTWTENRAHAQVGADKVRSESEVVGSGSGSGHVTEDNEDKEDQEDEDDQDVGCIPIAEPMAWGADIGHLSKYGEFTHVVCCDLVSRSFSAIVNSTLGHL